MMGSFVWISLWSVCSWVSLTYISDFRFDFGSLDPLCVSIDCQRVAILLYAGHLYVFMVKVVMNLTTYANTWSLAINKCWLELHCYKTMFFIYLNPSCSPMKGNLRGPLFAHKFYSNFVFPESYLYFCLLNKIIKTTEV